MKVSPLIGPGLTRGTGTYTETSDQCQEVNSVDESLTKALYGALEDGPRADNRKPKNARSIRENRRHRYADMEELWSSQDDDRTVRCCSHSRWA